MDFIQKIDALEAEGVVGVFHDIRVVLEALDIDDGDLWQPGVVMDGEVRFDVCRELTSGINGVDMQATAAELTASLSQQINAIHDEVELRHDAAPPVVIREEVDAVEGQRRLPAALRVPDDAFTNPFIELPFDGLGREDLRVAHDMLLQPLFRLHIGDAKAQHKGQAST